MTDTSKTIRRVRAGAGVALALLIAGAATAAAPGGGERVVAFDERLFDGLGTVVVSQSPDIVYGRDVDYEAWPLAQVAARAFPDWKQLLAGDAVLILRAHGGYEPLMMFSDAFTGSAFVTRRIAGRTAGSPYDCWIEGGSKHCDLGYFLVWTDGFYPDRPQPWGITEIELVDFAAAFGNTVPRSDDSQVLAGFEAWKHYCIECHRVNFEGGSKATDHVVRGGPLTRELLAFFVRDYRRANPASWMPDFSNILGERDIDALYRYLSHMYRHHNVCSGTRPDPRCPESRAQGHPPAADAAD